MIFLTVGSLDPFDRLVEAVDTWVGQTSPRLEIFGQIANGNYVPKHFPYVDFVTQKEYRRRFEEAALVISHAGMGSILAALELGQRIIIMPRVPSREETRNDHQLATAERFGRYANIIPVDSATSLAKAGNEYFALRSELSPPSNSQFVASESLISAIRHFVTNSASQVEKISQSAQRAV